jgi:hypothetical protein
MRASPLVGRCCRLVGESARREIDSVRDIMTENIERVLERGERIDLLVDKVIISRTLSISRRADASESAGGAVL